MKKRVLCIAMIAGLGAAASVINATERIDPISTGNTGCLGSPYNNPSVDNSVTAEDGAEEDPVILSLQYKDGVLTVTWHRFQSDCCTEGFNSWIEKTGENTLVLDVRKDKGEDCDCMCTYDVTSTFSGIEPGTYIISFSRFTEEVMIEEGCDISLSKAPSGIRAVSDDAGLLSLSAEGLLRVNSSEKAMVEIYDAGGSVRARLTAHPGSDIDINSLPKGIYVAKVTASNRTSTLRFTR